MRHGWISLESRLGCLNILYYIPVLHYWSFLIGVCITDVRHRIAFVGIIRVVSHVGIRQHSSAFVSIRQNTSEYVSIRQFTALHSCGIIRIVSHFGLLFCTLSENASGLVILERTRTIQTYTAPAPGSAPDVLCAHTHIHIHK